ncbi:hypothetical protein [Marivita hallyeonensis]|uniref:Uncharacterized protein n=1 Tax=Marivita hallyeonensis TaxID=996342 RepID=A0A1M5XWG7_9RHOB|nr:hypothetical protein [Marivita hallyeonensis]SHI04096.1 hypothetical protein SAMN05443551_4164 [Marivita hallyeonensis]
MSLFCAVFGFLLSSCTSLEDRVGVFEIKTPIQGHVSCESIDDYEVCAWIENFKLTRFYPKQQNATLYRGAQVLEGRSIQLPNGFKTSFSFYWSGPAEFLLGSFFETHTSAMRKLAPILNRHGLVVRETSEQSSKERLFSGVAHIPSDQLITGLVVRATCGDAVPVSRAIIIQNYPSHKTMLNCLRN